MPSTAAGRRRARCRRWARARCSSASTCVGQAGLERRAAPPSSGLVIASRRRGARTSARGARGCRTATLPTPRGGRGFASASSRSEISTRARMSGRASAGGSSRRSAVAVAGVVEEVLLELVQDEQQDPAAPLDRCAPARRRAGAPRRSPVTPAAAATARRMARTGSPCQASTSTIARRLPPLGTPSPSRSARQHAGAQQRALAHAARAVQHRQPRREQVRRRRGRARARRPKNRSASRLAVRGSARGRATPVAAVPRSPGDEPIAEPRAEIARRTRTARRRRASRCGCARSPRPPRRRRGGPPTPGTRSPGCSRARAGSRAGSSPSAGSRGTAARC